MKTVAIETLPTDIQGPLLISPHLFADERGQLAKFFRDDERLGEFYVQGVTEVFHTTSQKNVLRGLHFQHAPYEIEKIVHVISGAILDVIVDIRPQSLTFKKVFSIKLDAQMKQSLYIPRGFAHGYLSLEPATCVLYLQAGAYSPTHEAGIHFASLGFDWGIKDPIVSSKDAHYPHLEVIQWKS